MMKFKSISLVAAAAMLSVGCAMHEAPVTDKSELDALRAELARQESEKSTLRSELASLQRQQEETKQAATPKAGIATDPMADLPAGAKPGDCYARVFEPPQHVTETKQVVKRAASEKLEIVPATYEWVEERVMTKPRGMRIETVPARYEWAEQTVVVEPERTELVEVPAQFETVTEQVLVREAYTTWKKGRGPIERLDEATGEIMCLVEVPAEYETVTRTVMKTPPTTREVVTPAQTKVVRTQVMVEPARTVEIEIPAEYETVKVRKLVTPAREVRREIPAEYGTVTETRLVNKGNLRWQSILCETNTSPDLITRLQRALHDAGYNAGPVDGVLGRETRRAVDEYQRAEGLATGQLTLETLKSLGVEV